MGKEKSDAEQSVGRRDGSLPRWRRRAAGGQAIPIWAPPAVFQASWAVMLFAYTIGLADWMTGRVDSLLLAWAGSTVAFIGGFVGCLYCRGYSVTDGNHSVDSVRLGMMLNVLCGLMLGIVAFNLATFGPPPFLRALGWQARVYTGMADSRAFCIQPL